MKRSEGEFKGLDRIELFYQVWTFAQVRGVIVVTHGLGEHSESYTRLAEGLSKTDWELWAFDLRGHGKSDGKRGTVGKFSDYTADLHKFIQLVKEARPGVPVVLLGHSMGGLVTTNTIIEYPALEFTALVLSSPLFAVAVEVPKIKKLGAQFLNKYVPDLTLYNEIVYRQLTSDKEVINEYYKDTLRHDRISSGLYVQMLGAMEKAMAHAAQITCPLLLQQAGADTVVSCKASEKFFKNVGSEEKKLQIYEDLKHEIYNEVYRQQVFADLIDWLNPFLKVEQ